MSTTAVHLVTELSFPCLSLASVRERIGITLEEIAQSTRIACYYLRAIETEQFAELPGGVYATSYIRQYARAIGYNETALLNEYHARTEEAQIPAVTGQEAPCVTTRFGEALGEAIELFRGRVPAKPRTQHPA